MNKPSFLRTLLLSALLALTATGCVSTVTVSTDAPGAFIRYRGHGRPSYPWRYADPGYIKNAGDKCQFQTYYGSVDVYAFWEGPDKKIVKSDVKTISLSNWRDPEPILLKRKK